jgi:hypothetical protein
VTSNNTEELFEQVRTEARNGNLVVLRLDGMHLLLPAMPSNSVRPEMKAAVEKLIPSTTKRMVAVIGDTSWASASHPSLQAANQAVPFWGLLMGFSSIGHAVWVFDGSGELLCAGCSGADVLIVDSASLVTLPNSWQMEAAKVMRNPQILVHDRASYKLICAVPGQGAFRSASQH